MKISQPRVPEAIIFDIGGVLVDIDFERATSAWLAISRLSTEELRQRFAFDSAYEQHERGEINTDTYFRHLASELELDGTFDQIAAGWNSILIAEIPRTFDLVSRIPRAIPCYGFSNTNPLHALHWETLCPSLGGALRHVFVSHHIGARKPEPRSFLRVCDLIELSPESVLFLDDSPVNIRVASEIGMDAVLVEGPHSVESALLIRRVLSLGHNNKPSEAASRFGSIQAGVMRGSDDP